MLNRNISEVLLQEYHTYFKITHEFFVNEFHRQDELIGSKEALWKKLKESINPHHLRMMSNNLGKKQGNHYKASLVIDVANVFLAKLTLEEYKHLVEVEKMDNKNTSFIIVNIHAKKNQKCPYKKKCARLEENQGRKMGCPCTVQVYQIRPYTLQIIGALSPFYELIAMSCLPKQDVIQIVNHLEKLLNEPKIKRNMMTVKQLCKIQNSPK